MGEGVASPPGERQQVGKPLAHCPHLCVAGLAVGERAQRALVVADGIIVGVYGPPPVAGGNQIARTLRLVGREAPVVTQGLQVAQALRVCARGELERPACPLV